MRVARIIVASLVLALLLAATSTASAGTISAPPSIRVAFTGSASGHFVDVERWVLLSSGECYLRRMRDQTTGLTWSVGFSGARTLSTLAAPVVSGTVSGTEVRDSCDEVAEELPPDAPDDWLQSLRCNDKLAPIRPGGATWSNGVLRVHAPPVALAKSAVCTALPRSEELSARIPLPVSKILALAPGTSLRLAVGSSRPATGSYRSRANCLHPAKPYDGYRSFDKCADTLTWSGTVTVTRL